MWLTKFSSEWASERVCGKQESMGGGGVNGAGSSLVGTGFVEVGYGLLGVCFYVKNGFSKERHFENHATIVD